MIPRTGKFVVRRTMIQDAPMDVCASWTGNLKLDALIGLVMWVCIIGFAVSLLAGCGGERTPEGHEVNALAGVERCVVHYAPGSFYTYSPACYALAAKRHGVPMVVGQ